MLNTSLPPVAVKTRSIHENQAWGLQQAVLNPKVDWITVCTLVNDWISAKDAGESPVTGELTVQKWTLLHFAAWEQKSEYVALLIARGAKRLARDYRGCTPLHAAAGVLFEEQMVPNMPCWTASRQRELYDLLSDGGRMTDVRADDGRSPLHLAVACGNHFATQYLLEHGHPPNAQDARGETPLFYLVQFEPCNWRLLAKLLFQYGADVFVENNRSRVALDEALDVSSWDMLRVLLAEVREGAEFFEEEMGPRQDIFGDGDNASSFDFPGSLGADFDDQL